MSRPSDGLQPSSKRRPGEQLTKDNADESDEDAPTIDPGTWGKADQATMAKRKIIKARRGAGGGAEQAAGGATAATDNSSNPFAGVSLTSPAAAVPNPFAGVSLLAAKVPETTIELASDDQPSSTEGTQAAGKEQENTGAAAAAAAAKETAPDQETAAKPRGETKTDTTPIAEHTEAAPAVSSTPADASAANVDRNGAAPSSQPGCEDKKQDPADATQGSTGGSSLFGSTGFGGFGTLASNSSGGGAFGSLGSSSGFAGGFGGFAAAAKDGGSSGGSLFGSYTAPQPGGSLFGSSTTPAFGSSLGSGVKQSKDADDDDEKATEANGEGDAVFGGADVPPVVQLSEVPKQTGEEQETAVFAGDGALFEFVDGKEWKERGRGELRINFNQLTQQARLVMRQRGSQRLLLNANLYPKMSTCKMVGGKGVTFAAVNAAVGTAGAADDGKGEGAADGREVPAAHSTDASSSHEGAEAATAAATAAGAAAMKTYAFRVKSAERIEAFVGTVDRYKGIAATVDSEAGRVDDAGTGAVQEV